MDEQKENLQDAIKEDPLAIFAHNKTEAKVAAKLLPVLTERIAAAADARYAAQYRVQYDELQTENAKALAAALEELREAAKPLSDDDLHKLLEQEYGTFDVRLSGPSGAVTVTIRELPIAAEKKLLTTIRKAIGPVLKVISTVEWESLAGASQLERLDKIIELVPGSLDVVCECVALCLNPDGEQKFCTGEWVKGNLGLNRILSILMAQVSASRYRDFFSLASRLFQQSRMTSR